MIEFETLITTKLGAYRIGKAIAGANSEEQAKFFEGLSEGFQEFSKGDKDGAKMLWIQMLWIKDNVSQRTRDFIKKLAKYICED